MPALPPRRLILLFACLAALGGAGCGAAARTGPESFAPLVKRVLPSVVNIAVTETVVGSDPLSMLPPDLQKQFRDRQRSRSKQVSAAGSGTIIDSAGYIVTNNHVVGNADTIVVSLSDGTELPARLIGTDELTDVALIKVNAASALPAATWGDSRAVEIGDWVLAAGNPFGLGGSVTAGIVSARGRDIGAGPFDDFLQIDAPINPGNSGGPLFNMDGQVVGMNTAILSPTGVSVGIGFAIPSELVSKIVAQLRDKGRIERGWLGVSVQDVAANGKSAGGVGIAVVDRTGPAAKSGLKAGDIVTALNGEPVDSARSLIKTVATTPPGNTVRLTVRRQGREIDIQVAVGRRPKSRRTEPMRILVVEDDKETAGFVVKGLREAGHVVEHAANGRDGLFMAASESFDAIVLDRMLPGGVDGLKLLETLRSQGNTTPAIFLSAMAQVDDRVRGLKAGGDDYMTKPFAFSELLARVEGMARRGKTTDGPTTKLTVADLEMDLLSRGVKRAGQKIDLQPREFRLLEFLMRHAGQVVTRTMLLEGVWDYHFDPQTNVIDVHVSRLRQKIDKPFDIPLIHTVRNAGYMLRPEAP